MADNLCMICLDEVDAEHEHALDACGHSFHPKCLVRWFQRGNISCPTCRSDARETYAIPAMALQARANYIRRTIGRRAAAPPELKALLSKLRAAEQKQKDRQREYTDFTRNHAATLRQLHALRRKRYTGWKDARRYERLVGLFQCPSLTLPALVVTRYDSDS